MRHDSHKVLERSKRSDTKSSCMRLTHDLFVADALLTRCCLIVDANVSTPSYISAACWCKAAWTNVAGMFRKAGLVNLPSYLMMRDASHKV